MPGYCMLGVHANLAGARGPIISALPTRIFFCLFSIVFYIGMQNFASLGFEDDIGTHR